MKMTIICMILWFLPTILSAQSADALQTEAMNKLDWFIGEWQGEAWTKMGPANPDTVIMVEKIKKSLNGTIILVEGVGREKTSMGEPGKVVHNAFAVISYDEKAQKFRWQAWRVLGGYFNESEPIITQDGFSWSIKTPRGIMRYTLKLTDKGEWHEVGEYSRDGEEWQKFFNMLLSRTD